ncbi:Scr1 family TA system antitoxin-like transcriptional regulator [Streptomyces sp. NPDC088124]|uniref:Scr1 family TA system antitoxin-like transcriptional regulator n=1 Tax=Streptomyces sp. NPDC088124 TaxID=3154654 RepID=UPI0034156218
MDSLRPPDQFKDYVLLEQKAVGLQLYAMHAIQGFFQTEEHARALIGGGYPPLPVEELYVPPSRRISSSG